MFMPSMSMSKCSAHTPRHRGKLLLVLARLQALLFCSSQGLRSNYRKTNPTCASSPIRTTRVGTRVCAQHSSFTPHTSGECDPGIESDLSRVDVNVIRTYSRRLWAEHQTQDLALGRLCLFRHRPCQSFVKKIAFHTVYVLLLDKSLS
jgi:hypothetical protein